MSTRTILLKKIDVINRLGVCERTLENLVKSRKFPSGLKLEKNAVWDEAAVEQWLAKALEHQLNWAPPKRAAKATRTN